MILMTRMNEQKRRRSVSATATATTTTATAAPSDPSDSPASHGSQSIQQPQFVKLNEHAVRTRHHNSHSKKGSSRTAEFQCKPNASVGEPLDDEHSKTSAEYIQLLLAHIGSKPKQWQSGRTAHLLDVRWRWYSPEKC